MTQPPEATPVVTPADPLEQPATKREVLTVADEVVNAVHSDVAHLSAAVALCDSRSYCTSQLLRDLFTGELAFPATEDAVRARTQHHLDEYRKQLIEQEQAAADAERRAGAPKLAAPEGSDG